MAFGKGFRLGHIFGIELRVDWSWSFIFVLVAWSLAASFGQLHDDWSAPLRWATAVGAALLFFASVVAHELSHSLVAIRQGVPVRRIILFLFGGVSDIQRNPPTPKAEFWITVVGPLTSLLIGWALLGIAGVLAPGLEGVTADPEAALAELGPAATIVFWLGSINVMLGVFNLVPGFPLDGGRLVRAALWAITGDLTRATLWAARGGQAVAFALIGIGLAMVFGVEVPFFGTGWSGLWLALIGWFLNTASINSFRQVLIEDVLSEIQVGAMMRDHPDTVPGHLTVDELVRDHILGGDDHAFPVVDGEELVGLVSLDDVREVPRDDWAERRVRDIMTGRDKLVTAAPGDEASEAFHALARAGVRQLPVVADGRLVGLLRRRDVLTWLQLNAGAKEAR